MSRAWYAEHAPKQPCARCGTDTFSQSTPPLHRRCRPAAAPRARETWTERKRRAAAVQEHRERYGEWCPGWPATGRMPHTVVPPNKLSADHVVSVAQAGPEGERGPLQVMCRACNASKRERSGSVAVRPPPSVRYPGPSRAWSVVYVPSGTC